MTTDQGLVVAYVLDGQGGGRTVGWDEVRAWKPGDALLWVHLDYSQESARQWMRDESGIDDIIAESLLLSDVRPRSLPTRDGLMVILRGVNLNPGQHPDDMVSLRMWVERDRIITLRRRHLLSIDDLRERIDRGVGPVSSGSFLVDVSDRLVERMSNVIHEVEDTIDRLDEQIATGESRGMRHEIADVRREAILLRRYLAPQRDAMSRLHNEPVEWLDEVQRMRLREIADRTMRYVEDLDSARDRAGVGQEELATRMAEQMNNRMYVLSVVAALFLPLGFVTGLLGVNVAGIPGTEDPGAFIAVCLMMVLLALVQVWFFRRRGWL